MSEKESWYSDGKGKEFDQKALLSLFAIYVKSMDDALNRHFNVRNYFTVLLSVLSGLYVGGISQIAVAEIDVPRLSTLWWVFLILLFVIILLSVVALRSTTRYYTFWLRRVAWVVKLENMLGIDDQVKAKKGSPKELIWKEDERFTDQDYWESRKAFKSSRDFINKKKWEGDNKWAVITFVSFCALGIALLFFHGLWF